MKPIPLKEADDPKLDKFYDETPAISLTFRLFMTTMPRPYEFHYREVFDGAEDDTVLDRLVKRAQADMFNVLNRTQEADPDIEFSKWQMLDSHDVVVRESNELHVDIKGK